MLPAIRAALVALVTLTILIVWLPFSRSWMDGENYQWALPLLVAVAGAALWTGWRGSSRVFGLLAGLWFVIWLVSILVLRWSEGPILIQGDTLGFTVDITAVATVLTGAGIAGALALLLAPERLPQRLRWAPLNTTFAVLFALLYAGAFGLLATGEPDGRSNQIGVFTLLALPVLANLAFLRWRPGGLF